MRLWIALSLHQLPLDSVLAGWADTGRCCAVVEHERLIALSPAARQAGLRTGQRRASAQALAPQAELFARDRAAETLRLQEAALALLQYTPQLALREPDALLLDVGASLRLFGGPRALARRVRATLATLCLHGRLGMAPTAQGAWLLARGAAPAALRLSSLARRLDALPVELLPEAQAQAAWLQGLGCEYLAQLRALPRAGLQRRAGPDLLMALDRAYGQTAEAHAWFIAAPRFEARLELADYAEHAQALLGAAARLTEQLSGWLHGGRLAVRSVTLRLEHERGRRARPPSCLTLTMAEPVWHGRHLQDLLRERLERLELPEPVIAMALSADQTQQADSASQTLFPDPASQAADHARLLDLLAARLGPQAVRHAAACADHRPEQANQWQPVHQPAPRHCPAGPVLERPFWLLEPARALPEQNHRPVYQGQPLRLLRGPERIESGWWDDAPAQRDYFVAEDQAGARYWLYRERGQRWFLHGLYG
ncbi:Y-family DNA polymerase [Bordetella trematum]|uniref:Y-family DNA polymerase n=1 Tax=Bordetella trematum TaxID=123899 RepID=UPI000D9941C6|nr:DNA polymerase Y family protein [Bordetella trematum]SPU50568.1 DNA polymerase IV [Bordetella trematum]VDH06807.1 DNA polymerase IV [Bordetella trematum]